MPDEPFVDRDSEGGARDQHSRLSYRIVAISLYRAEANIADRLTSMLQRAGWPRANRSLVGTTKRYVGWTRTCPTRRRRTSFGYFVDRQTRRLRDPEKDSDAAVRGPGTTDVGESQ